MQLFDGIFLVVRKSKRIQPLWRTAKKLNTEVPFDPAFPLLRVYSQIYAHTKTVT